MPTRRQALRALAYLAGTATVAPAALTLLHSCAPDRPDLPWTPEFFTDDEARFVTAYVDTLLPRTATPGGLDVGVDRFIDKVLAATVPAEGDVEVPGGADAGAEAAKNPMRQGILEFDERAQTKFGEFFRDLGREQREELFGEAEKSPHFQPLVWGMTVAEQVPVGFYRSLKSMVLWGYLSSEQIGTEVLNYDPVPGEYDGDIPLASVGGRSWSL